MEWTDGQRRDGQGRRTKTGQACKMEVTMNLLVMDFGGTSVKYGIVDETGNILRSGRKDAPLRSKEQFVETAGEIYGDYKNDVEGVSISIPGYVDTKTGTLIGSGAYRSLYGCCLPELLRETIPVKIAVENDGKCGALAEAWKGALAECRDGVVMILGTGIAGGIIKDKKIHAGWNLTAGEFSNILVRPQDPTFCGLAVMNCAAFGLTYQLCKAKNLALDCQDCSSEMINIDKSFGSRFPENKEPKERIKADGKQLAKWLEEGDPIVQEIYNNFLGSLCTMIFNVQVILAPQRVVIGGGLSRMPGLIDDVKSVLKDLYAGTGLGPELQAKVVKSSYLDECNLIGAAYHYMICFP